MNVIKKTRVLIVDDSALIRRLFTELLNADPGIEVLDTASDPFEAREKIKKLNPDVITLDVEMPHMDGIVFLEKIMSLRPMPVVMVSSMTQKGADTTLRALELGAVDYISKPTEKQTRDTLSELQAELIDKVKSAAYSKVQQRRAVIANENTVDPSRIIRFVPTKHAEGKLIAMGASTGGVEALREIISVLPGNSPPILVTQHMPSAFTKSFARRLDSCSQVKVHEAEHNQVIVPGNVYIAPGGMHMEIRKSGTDLVCHLFDGPNISGHKPSVDVLFTSVASIMKSKAVGVILTGMGRDGAEGMLAMKRAGAFNIGQNEESCVVYGMPKAAFINGAIGIEMPLGKIAEEMLGRCNISSRTGRI